MEYMKVVPVSAIYHGKLVKTYSVISGDKVLYETFYLLDAKDYINNLKKLK